MYTYFYACTCLKQSQFLAKSEDCHKSWLPTACQVFRLSDHLPVVVHDDASWAFTSPFPRFCSIDDRMMKEGQQSFSVSCEFGE